MNSLPWRQRPIRMMRQDYVSDYTRFKQANLEQLAWETRDRWHVNCEWVRSPGISVK